MNEHQVNNMIKLQLATTLTEASDKWNKLKFVLAWFL